MSEAQEEYRIKLEEALVEERDRSKKAIETALEEERGKSASLVEDIKVDGTYSNSCTCTCIY